MCDQLSHPYCTLIDSSASLSTMRAPATLHPPMPRHHRLKLPSFRLSAEYGLRGLALARWGTGRRDIIGNGDRPILVIFCSNKTEKTYEKSGVAATRRVPTAHPMAAQRKHGATYCLVVLTYYSQNDVLLTKRTAVLIRHETGSI